jgi:hypothetical protein
LAAAAIAWGWSLVGFAQSEPRARAAASGDTAAPEASQDAAEAGKSTPGSAESQTAASVKEELRDDKKEGTVDEAAILSRRNKCSEVCRQDEACVHGRCIAACTPECRPGTTCAPDGSCVRPPIRRDLRTEDELARIAGAESANDDEAFVLDPAGIAFLGVQASYERGATSAWVGRLLLMNTGLMSYTIEPQNEFERFDFGFGTAFGYRHYETSFGNLRGFYFGGGGLVHLVRVNDDTHDYARTTILTGPYGEFGYRWVFAHLLFGFGPNLSLRLPVANIFDAQGGHSCATSGTCPGPGAARFEGTLSLEIGWLQ